MTSSPIAAPPLMPDVGVIALVPNRWSAHWQPRNHVLTRLARHFHVVWVNPAPEWRDVVRRPLSFRVTDPHPAPGLTVHSPDLHLPQLYRPRSIARRLFQQRLRGARRSLIQAGCTRIILYIWHPRFVDALSAIPCDLTCYHIDDEYSFSPVDQPISPEEMRLLTESDHVFIHSPGLLEKKGSINPNTTFVPNGVDYDAFARPAPIPPELMAIPRPRIGYAGWLKRQLDWSLLSHLAERHPAWSFVLVGGQKNSEKTAAPIAELSKRANVHILGRKPTAALAAYPQHFDVCIMPYRVDDYTKYIYPMKLHEYLAAGRPTVGAPIAALQEFTDVVALPSTAEEWSEALTAALRAGENTPERRAARQRVAREHDWQVLVDRIARAMVGHPGMQDVPARQLVTA
jgi:glycosyltransferase involved in cell wall biosynthesis